MPYDHTLDIAKRVSDAHAYARRDVAAEAGVTRDVFEDEIAKRAEAIRRPSQSREQAWTAYATQTPQRQALLKAALSAPQGKPPKQAPQDLPYQPAGEASAEIERQAKAMAKERNITYERAYTIIITDPSRKGLLRQLRQEEETQTRRVRESRWPLNSAERESRTKEWI